MNQNPKKPIKQPMKRKPDYLIMLFTLVIVIGVFLFLRDALSGQVQELTFSEVENAAQAQHIEAIEYTLIGGDNFDLVKINGKIYDQHKALYGGVVLFESIMRIDQAETLLITVENYGGSTNIVPKSGVTLWTILLNLVPMILILVVLFIIFRNANSQNSKAFDFAKNRAKLNREKSITFKDVAGADEEKQEMAELIDFLKTPKKYVDMGARIPKGVLLVGSPGTGKTLLARAVAGEANVPFFSISGSDFVEMFVGVGASRVRDLFKVAKENSPCIIFIDEIDAVGRQRGAGLGGGHDEREQTLNQLLVEMDGFSTNMGIIIIAATNRPDVLDPALLRPGRFDRQITINLPDVRGREEILKVHARNKKLDPKIKLNEFANRIPGFSGADIENLLNEAALLAARDNRTMISEQDMDEAIDRVMMGPAKKSRKYSVSEKNIVAYHEAGHAVIGIKLEDANVVQKVTIIPRGTAGGYNLMVPLEEKFLETKKSLIARITSYLGGRVAEEIVFETVTTGAYNDFQIATRIARSMVTEYGMSDLGPIQYESSGGNVFLGRDYFKEKNFSDQVAHEIDKEVRHIITTCFDKARHIITENRDLLDLIAKYLVEVETLTKADIDEIVETKKLSWWEEKKAEDTNEA
ncbi:MAG: ATP-dependent zinc metalloprotease FtsH [Acholeplasmataceae bacterium]|jgi:cell division protease FtsH|nr:ATP-dependent zinc metalloprotease FtsH [Acholeplasmataceae bacterium]